MRASRARNSRTRWYSQRTRSARVCARSAQIPGLWPIFPPVGARDSARPSRSRSARETRDTAGSRSDPARKSQSDFRENHENRKIFVIFKRKRSTIFAKRSREAREQAFASSHLRAQRARAASWPGQPDQPASSCARSAQMRTSERLLAVR